MSFTIPYSKLYILTEIRANDVKLISVDRQKLDLSKYIYLWYRKSILVEIQLDSTNIKNDPRMFCFKRHLPYSPSKVHYSGQKCPDRNSR